MPYLDAHGLIFVAIPKTGSTSVVRALRTICSPEHPMKLVRETIDARFRERYNVNAIGDRKPGNAKHLSALQLKYILGDAEFARCLKFSVVRNPWARTVSRYFFDHVDAEPSAEEKLRRGTSRKFHDLEFEQWVKRAWKQHNAGKRKSSQLAKLVDLDGQLLVDHVGRLENVQATLDWVSQTLGIAPIPMPHVNGARKGHYAQFYNAATRDMVAEICREDIEYFGFQFEESPPGPA